MLQLPLGWSTNITWKRVDRNDACVRSHYEAVHSVPEALEIVKQYLVEKAILLAGDANKEALARLIRRFRGAI